MLNDLQQSPGGLPLLQYTLTELWHRQQDNQLKLSVYHQLGGITGTLKQRADQVYDALTPEQQQTAKHLFMSLTQLGEGAEDTRRRITQASLVSAQHPEARVAAVVKRLADANLVVTDDRGEAAQGTDSATVDVAHEALIRCGSGWRGTAICFGSSAKLSWLPGSGADRSNQKSTCSKGACSLMH